jgi:hypothetical protein
MGEARNIYRILLGNTFDCLEEEDDDDDDDIYLLHGVG